MINVELFDPVGNNIEHTVQPGELVCTLPHISLPLWFWGDSSGERFIDAYFNMYSGKDPSSNHRLVLNTPVQASGGKVTSLS